MLLALFTRLFCNKRRGAGGGVGVGAIAGLVGGKKRKLDVAGAFHSPFMQQAAVAMEALLTEVPLSDPEIPMISGMDGGVLAKAEDVRIALRDQMLSPVRRSDERRV